MADKKPDGRRRDITALLPSVGQMDVNQPLVDLATGLALPIPEIPPERLNDWGKARVVSLIVAGWTDEEICEAIVREKLILAYSREAVMYWRERPEVIALQQNRNRRALQVGYASKDKRVIALGELATAMEAEIIVRDRQTNEPRLRGTFVDSNGDVKDINRIAQSAMIRNYTEILEKIGNIVDTPFGKEINVTVDTNVKVTGQQATLGLGGMSRRDFIDRAKRLANILEEDEDDFEGMPASLNKTTQIQAIEGDFKIVDTDDDE